MLLTWGWAISIMVLLGMKLARIKLDDQLLLDGLIHIIASRLRGAFRRHVVFVEAEPRHNRPLLADVERGLDPFDFLACLSNRDDVAHSHLVRRDVHDLPVDDDVPVGDDLAGIAPRGRKTDAVDDVIEPSL